MVRKATRISVGAGVLLLIPLAAIIILFLSDPGSASRRRKRRLRSEWTGNDWTVDFVVSFGFWARRFVTSGTRSLFR